jgi:hypothetical protein
VDVRELHGNQGPYALKICPENMAFLHHYNSLQQLLLDVESVKSEHATLQDYQQGLIAQIEREFQRLHLLKQSEWERQRLEKNPTLNPPKITMVQSVWVDTSACRAFLSRDVYHSDSSSDSHFHKPFLRLNPTIIAIYLTVLILHLLCRLPQDGTSFLLAGLRSIVTLTLENAGSPHFQHTPLLEQIPKDPRTLIHNLNIEPLTQSYICCTACYMLYPDLPSDIQLLCSNIRGDGKACHTKLMRSRNIRGRRTFIPVSKYLHQSFKEWMGRLLSRPGIESVMDSLPHTRMSSGSMVDIWDGKVFKEFKGQDGKPFFAPSLKEGRYAFGLNVDGFNPFFNREAKQSVSVTGIYMVCFNLPPDMRYLPENMYLAGIIPGPGKPSKYHINPILSLLVDELLQFWYSGVYFSQTAKHPMGALVRCALIPLICDAIGARSVAGFRSISSDRFCTCCELEVRDIEDFDVTKWKPRDLLNHRTEAEAWRKAKTSQDKQLIEERSGIYWSELLRLPYWNPILFTVVDTMHNLYLGLLEDHCRDVWGISATLEDGDGLTSPAGRKYPFPSAVKLEFARKQLFDGNLKNVPKSLLWHLCAMLDLRRGGRRSQLVKTLMEWVGQDFLRLSEDVNMV